MFRVNMSNLSLPQLPVVANFTHIEFALFLSADVRLHSMQIKGAYLFPVQRLNAMRRVE